MNPYPTRNLVSFVTYCAGIGWVGPAVAWLIAPHDPIVARTPWMLVASAALAAVGAGLIIGSRRVRDETLDRDAKVARVLAKCLGFEVHDCGCVWDDSGYSASPPDADTVESTRVWIRKTDGARVKFGLVDRTLKRCHRCGRHYHDRERATLDDHDVIDTPPDQSYGVTKYECWPEDEPELRDELRAEHEILTENDL